MIISEIFSWWGSDKHSGFFFPVVRHDNTSEKIKKLFLEFVNVASVALSVYAIARFIWTSRQVVQQSSYHLDPDINLTEKAKSGAFSHLIPNESLNQLIAALSQKETPNALIVGPAGCGKTSIVEALAHKICFDPSIPPKLKGKQILSITASDFTSGCSLIGQQEARMRDFFKKVSQGNYIIFIDEFHAMTGRHNPYSANTLLDQLKPALASGAIQIIGATTLDESAMVFEDKAIKRRFTPIMLSEPANEELRQILKRKIASYSTHHGCIYKPEAIEKIIEVSEFLPGTNPAKSILLLDLLGSESKTKIVTADDVIAKSEILRKTEENIEKAEKSSPYSVRKIDLKDPNINLTLQAKKGAFTHLVPNPESLDPLMLALSQKEAPNALIVGPAGCGKTSIVEALAHKMCFDPNIHPQLKGKEILSITASDFISGCSLVGQVEERMKDFINKVSQGNYIIFIDEFHAMTGKHSESANTLLDQLKPVLASGKVQIIGATTLDESAMVFQGKAITRRFTPIALLEPTNETLRNILQKKAAQYAAHHGCIYQENVIEKLVGISEFLPGSNPAKSCHVLDVLGAKKAISGGKVSVHDLDEYLSSFTPDIGPSEAYPVPV